MWECCGKLDWGCFQGNVKKDVNYFNILLTFVACACIYARVYVCLQKFLTYMILRTVQKTNECVVLTREHRRI